MYIAEGINEHHSRHYQEYAEDLEGMLDRYRCAMSNDKVCILDYLDSTREEYITVKASQHRIEMAHLYID